MFNKVLGHHKPFTPIGVAVLSHHKDKVLCVCVYMAGTPLEVVHWDQLST